MPEAPRLVSDLDRDQQRELRQRLGGRTLPGPLQPLWAELCHVVSRESATIWQQHLGTKNEQLRLLWRLLRISTTTYFVLGVETSRPLRFRIDSNWDWLQHFELRSFRIGPRHAGQPEVGWEAVIRRRADRHIVTVCGHVEVRWSHGRFVGVPEAKVYLDTPFADIPGYHHLADEDEVSPQLPGIERQG